MVQGLSGLGFRVLYGFLEDFVRVVLGSRRIFIGLDEGLERRSIKVRKALQPAFSTGS